MAAERPSIDSFFLTGPSNKPSIDSFFVQPKPTTAQKNLKQQFGLPSKDRMMTAAISGLPAAAAGVDPKQAFKSSEFIAPTVGSVASTMTMGTPVPGAMAGRAINEGGKQALGIRNSQPRKLFGVGPTAPGLVNDLAAEGALAFAGDKAMTGAAKMIDKAAPGAREGAIRLVKNILRPGGKLAPKSDRIAETALNERLVSSNLGKMSANTQARMGQVDDQLDNIIQQYKDRLISPEDVVGELDNLEREYLTERANESGAATVRGVKEQISKLHGLYSPKETIVEESRRFVIPKGSESKQVTPQVKETFSKDMTGGLKQFQGKTRYESIRTKSGKFGQSEPKREFLTPKTVVEYPDDIVALNVPGGEVAKPRKIVSVSPKVTRKINKSEIPGGYVEPKRTVVATQEPQAVSVSQAQANKRGIYRDLEKKRANGGYGSETMGADIEARQEAARGYRRAIEKAIPEESVQAINRRYADLIDLGSAVNKRLPVDSRNNVFSLSDVVIGAEGMSNPEAFAVLGLKKMAEGAEGAFAQGMYEFSKNAPRYANKLRSPYLRSIAATAPRRLGYVAEDALNS